MRRRVTMTAFILVLSITSVYGFRLARGAISPSPNMQLTAAKMLQGKVIVDQEVLPLFDQLRTTLAKSPEGFQPQEISFLENMVFLTATEFALIRSVDANGRLQVPLAVTPVEFRLALIKYDTLEGGSCLTPFRILRDKRLVISDIFLFTGDVDKYSRVDPAFALKANLSPEKFKSAQEPFLTYLRSSARAPLTKPMREGDLPRFEAVLQWAKLQFVSGRPEQGILANTPTIFSIFGFSK